MKKIWGWIRAHPMITVTVVIVLIVIFVVLRRGSSSQQVTPMEGYALPAAQSVVAGTDLANQQAISAQFALEEKRIDASREAMSMQIQGALAIAQLESADRRYSLEQAGAQQAQQLAAQLAAYQTQSTLQAQQIAAQLEAVRLTTTAQQAMSTAQMQYQYRLENQRLKNERDTAHENRPRPILNFLGNVLGAIF